MRIFVIGRCLPDGKSSYGLFEFNQAKALARVGNEVAYCCADNRSLRVNRAVGSLGERRDGVRVFVKSLPIGSHPDVIASRVKTNILRAVLDRAISECGRPDVVMAHFPLLTLTPGVLDWFVDERIPLVCVEHWTRVSAKRIDARKLALLQRLVAQAAHFCCVSDDLRQSVEELTCDVAVRCPITVMPNMVSDAIFRPAAGNACADSPDGAATTYRFVAVGRLDVVKRFDLIIDALAHLGDENTRLTIVGDGACRRRLQHQIARRELSGRVTLAGGMSPEGVASVLRASDCYVSASSLETFGVPFVEAWMCGLPCIGADNNPLRREFRDGRGMLFEVDDVESLTQTMVAMMATEQPDAGAVSAWACERYSEEAVVAMLMELLGSCQSAQ